MDLKVLLGSDLLAQPLMLARLLGKRRPRPRRPLRPQRRSRGRHPDPRPPRKRLPRPSSALRPPPSPVSRQARRRHRSRRRQPPNRGPARAGPSWLPQREQIAASKFGTVLARKTPYWLGQILTSPRSATRLISGWQTRRYTAGLRQRRWPGRCSPRFSPAPA